MFSFWKCIIYVLPNDNKIINYNNNLYYSGQLLRLLNENDILNINQNITSITYGTYVGNQKSDQTINLGFRPQAVIVTKATYYNTGQNFNSGKSMFLYYAICGINNVNGNIHITNNGFSISRFTSINIYLNLADEVYTYIAFHSLT